MSRRNRQGTSSEGRRPPEREATPRDATAVPAFRKASDGIVVLYGYHAVREALRAGRRPCHALFATTEAKARLAEEIAAAALPVHLVDNAALDRRLGRDSVHQGVMLEAAPLPPIDLSEIERKSGIVLVLDQVTDPHNVGALLRTAAAFAIDALVMTERHAPALSGVVAKAASGGLEHVPIAPVVNLARALDELGDLGYRRIGLDSAAPAMLDRLALEAPVALVLGAEGAGLRRLTRERCDDLARLALPGAVTSLNVSNAGAIALALVAARLGAAAS